MTAPSKKDSKANALKTQRANGGRRQVKPCKVPEMLKIQDHSDLPTEMLSNGGLQIFRCSRTKPKSK